MVSRRHHIGGYLLLTVTLALVSVLLLWLALGSARAPAAPKCEVSLKYTPERPYANTPVTITARASNCDRIKKIVADQTISGKRRYPCNSGSNCTIHVTATKPQLVHFTAQATKNGKAVTSNKIAVRWSKPNTRAPRNFTMTIKNSAGKVVWKGVQNLATGRTTYPVGETDQRGLFWLPGGSKVTVSAYWDRPMSRGGEVSIEKQIWDANSNGLKTVCKTSTAGESGCSVKLTLAHGRRSIRDPDGHEAQQFHSNGRIAGGPRAPGGFVSAWVYLREPAP